MKIIILLFLTMCSLVGNSQDTTISKRYLDSLKYQLSMYVVSSYSHLNLYDRSEAKNRVLEDRVALVEEELQILVVSRDKTALRTSIFFTAMAIGVFGFFVTFSK